MTDAAHSLAYVRNAIAHLPDELRRALSTALPALTANPKRVVTTGVGASEGPARALAYALSERGTAASFCASSRFVCDAPRGDLLVVFSQGLCPNATLTLNAAAGFSQRWLVTSVAADDPSAARRHRLAAFARGGFQIIVAPPSSEAAALVRLVGPTVANLVALRLAAHLTQDAQLADCLTHAPQAYQLPPLLANYTQHTAFAIVTANLPSELAYGHRWKLLEGLLGCDPPVWDILQFAHGPLQACYDKELTLVLLECGHDAQWLTRLTRVLQPSQHTVLHFPSRHPSALAFFEHAAACDALLLAELEKRPRNLFDWPARQMDAPLYELAYDFRAELEPS